MSTPASVKGHPIHAMLVPLPIGLWRWLGGEMVYVGGVGVAQPAGGETPRRP